MTSSERRHFQRVTPLHPLRAAIGRARAYVLDGSISGVGLIHENALPQPGQLVRVEIATEIGPIILDCEVVRTVQHTGGQNGFTKSLCQSGLRVIAADHESAERLRVTFGANAARRGRSQDN